MQALSFWPSLIALLAPERCAACDGALVDEEPGDARSAFCGACSILLEPTELSHRGLPVGAPAAFLYGGPLADAIQKMKYGGRTDLARPLSRLLVERAVAYAGSVERVVPVPLHASRLRQRGVNQSALLARPVARALGVPFDPFWLVRVRPTREQAGLDRDARSHNLRGAFAARGMRAQRVLLIDDVRTTGATLAEAGEALLRAGCVEVHGLALARAAG
jgi:ComF family protein